MQVYTLVLCPGPACLGLKACAELQERRSFGEGGRACRPPHAPQHYYPSTVA